MSLRYIFLMAGMGTFNFLSPEYAVYFCSSQRRFLDLAWAPRLSNLGNCYLGSEGHGSGGGELECAEVPEWQSSVCSLPLTFTDLDTFAHKSHENWETSIFWMSVKDFYFHYCFSLSCWETFFFINSVTQRACMPQALIWNCLKWKQLLLLRDLTPRSPENAMDNETQTIGPALCWWRCPAWLSKYGPLKGLLLTVSPILSVSSWPLPAAWSFWDPKCSHELEFFPFAIRCI